MVHASGFEPRQAGSAEVQPAEDLVTAAVSPRSRGGVSLFDAPEPITSETVDEFTSEPSIIADARRELTKLGFAVLAQSDTTLSIVGPRSKFEEVFGSPLTKERVQVLDGQEAEFFASPADPDPQLLRPPASLSNLIEGVALSIPVEFHESALPPIAPIPAGGYRYLSVPHELGKLLNADLVHRNGTTGLGIKVAMVDTGFYRHPFYTRDGYRVATTLLGPGAADATQDTYGHGTGEAANIFSAAPDASLIPVKMGTNPVGAFNIAVAQNPKVITCSWTLFPSNRDMPGCTALNAYEAALAAAIADAVKNKKIVVCFSAGNLGTRGIPSGHPDIIAVGGVHVNYPDLTYQASSYASSFDSCLWPGRHVPDICGLVGNNFNNSAPLLMLPVQPGAALDSPNTGATNDGWGIFSGTSAASPQVAGVIALMLQKDPTLTPADIKTILKNSATDVKVGTSATGQVAGPGADAATGAGLVNAKYAWIIAMGSMASHFMAAPAEGQAEMIAAGQMPRVTLETMTDIVATLRGSS